MPVPAAGRPGPWCRRSRRAGCAAAPTGGKTVHQVGAAPALGGRGVRGRVGGGVGEGGWVRWDDAGCWCGRGREYGVCHGAG
ncbi:SEC-C metal-binding domain-containing protein [Streptomyces albidoflavus]|uniref:SEC-C metal-binding domain-containing protein n=1 Tax=Streptomyces albidoflavus TaxID=1886 RepID=UPI000D1B4B2F